MNEIFLRQILEAVSKGELDLDEALARLRSLPFESLGFACIDHHRSLRKGLSEVVFGEGKSPEQIIAIMERITQQGDNVLVTRLSREKSRSILERFPASTYHDEARVLTLLIHPVEQTGRGKILVISAGTSDIPVAQEAAVTAKFMGNKVETIFDVGVAGIHRLVAHAERLKEASVIIVVAGMEGALPSVVGGLVDSPIIAVPTSIGYGASFHGLAALLSMLNSCASGVVVVNIDNGFGAAYAATLINRIP
ncbi:MAG TPA: nickel pincer cofactor biosynthesis protein LarB [Desulfobacterales bacterium]|nr:nickel pincer cofactor biosynthesis protein LarB [Desulfobacterales bacterium]